MSRVHVATLALLLGLATNARAVDAPRSDPNPPPSKNWTATERWIWGQLLAADGVDTVNLDGYCKETRENALGDLDPQQDHDVRWQASCRTISAAFLRDILTRLPWRDALPPRGVGIEGARVTGDLSLDNAKLARAFWLLTCRLESGVTLLRTRTDSMIGLISSVINGEFIGDGLATDSDLQLRAGTEFRGNVSLNQARVNGMLDMTDATVAGALSLQGIRASDVFLRSSATATAPASIGTVRGVDMTLAKITNRLDLRGARFGDVTLTGATIAGDLVLGTRGTQKTTWTKSNGTPSKLDLRNAATGNLIDEESAWPDEGNLTLQGFAFAHLSGAAGKAGIMSGHEDPDWWVRLDSQYSVTPYTQLAANLAAIGDRGAAHRIQFLARQRARAADWDSGNWGAWLGQTFLLVVAGYGIGGYTFIVLIWVFGLATLGAAVLALTVADATTPERGLPWCFGASLSRLLPVIEINKEFTDYFNDPKREHLTKRWQQLFFDCLGIVGWVLGALLIAAVSGLTQNP